MFNKVVLIGRLTRDPELRYTPNNIPVCSFSLAVNRPFQSNNTNNDKNADFFNCTAWRKQAENVAKYVNKGSMVAIEGRLQTRDYMDEKINARRYVTEIVCDSVVFLDSKSSGTDDSYDAKNEDNDIDTGTFNNVEDDLPF
ncbi:MAG: single-stranded DNA-binding protein [Tenericutes bacterium HGW-Tenericutes-5]|jgi:single-strand DNA-binding protein|nr:MAG: single-stranded DNA-binding protein [Tenericutes bacterium HGW-Tenericutes-5]